MPKRVTDKQLEELITHLNEITGNPTQAWIYPEDGRNYSQPGTYTLGGAYGMVRLERIVSNGGSIEDLSGFMYRPALATFIKAMIMGVEATK